MDNKDLIKELFEDIKIPDRLLPENIAIMLKNAQLAEKPSKTPKQDKHSDLLQSKATAKRQGIRLHKNSNFRRIASTAAAFMIMLVGLAVYFNNGDSSAPMTSGTDFGVEIDTAEDYNSLYNTFRRIYVSETPDEITTTASSGDPASPIIPNFGTGSGGQQSYFSALNISDKLLTETTEAAQLTQGIAEADIVKTDGQNIYYISDRSLYLVSLKDGEMKLESVTKSANIVPVEMFISNNSLVVVSSKLQSSADSITPTNKYNTVVDFYNISDKNRPSIKTTYEQSGSYVSSKMIDNNVYIVTCYSSNAVIDSEQDYEKYIPTYIQNGETSYIQATDISIPKNASNTNYTIISGLDANAELPLISAKALLGYDSSVFMTRENAYVAGFSFEDNKQYTNVAKFNISNGLITLSASTKVDGFITNSRSMDEYKGDLRIGTTSTDKASGSTSNAVYIYDSTLKKIGEITNLTANDSIKSITFSGSLGFVHTKNQEKAATVLDFSDPTRPIVISNPITEDYSGYLVSFGSSRLLAFGEEIDASGNKTGYKLSVYESTGGGTLTETSSISLGNDLASAKSNAEFNTKCLSINSDNNLIGVPVSFFDGVDTCNRYYMIKYDASTATFAIVGIIETHDTTDNSFIRGVFVEDKLYACAEKRIISANISDMSIISTLDLAGGANDFLASHEIEVPDFSQGIGFDDPPANEIAPTN